jgi:hypothetical protein
MAVAHIKPATLQTIILYANQYTAVDNSWCTTLLFKGFQELSETHEDNNNDDNTFYIMMTTNEETTSETSFILNVH